MMKKILSFTAFLLLISVALSAQQNQSVLWEISGNGSSKPSYLLGTVHVAPIALLDSFPKLMKIASQCDLAIFESGSTDIGNVEQYSAYSPPLDSVFTPEEYALVDSFFTASPYGSIRPHNDDADLLGMLQAVMILSNIDSKAQGSTFDSFIRFKLMELKKPTFRLDESKEIERIEKNLQFNNLAKFIVYTIRKGYEVRDLKAQGFVDYDLYLKSFQNPMNIDRTASENILNFTVKRHSIWLPKIDSKLKDGYCFIAVGLLHLQFQTGLISLLREKGYTLKPVEL
nr:TraB/GumN family protein [uncultured Dyadobacter sp.]